MRTGSPGGLHERAFAATFAIARSSRAASAATRGSDSGTSTSMPRPPSGRLASAFGTTSSRPIGRRSMATEPVWIRLMSSRLPTRLFRRSASSSIVARNSPVSCAFHGTSGCRRLLTEALIEASGVRRSCETAARMAVRSSFTSTSSAAPAASARARASRSTSTLTVAATMTNTTIARRFSAWSIARVCSGGVKNQFSSNAAARPVTMAGHSPPTVATATTNVR